MALLIKTYIIAIETHSNAHSLWGTSRSSHTTSSCGRRALRARSPEREIGLFRSKSFEFSFCQLSFKQEGKFSRWPAARNNIWTSKQSADSKQTADLLKSLKFSSMTSITYVPALIWPLNGCIWQILTEESQIWSIDLLASPQVKIKLALELFWILTLTHFIC